MRPLDLSRPFGRAWREEWLLDPSTTYLNHGTVGATPKRILHAQRELQDRIESQPAKFLLRELSAIRTSAHHTDTPYLRQAAHDVGLRLGAHGDDLVFVDNVTAAANAVAQSMTLGPGDEVVATTLGYGGLTNGVRAAVRRHGATLIVVSLPFPVADPAVLTEAVMDAVTPATRLAVVDHISAQSALVFPVADIAKRCRERGVLTFADGAHVPGNIALDIESLGVDFYGANLHKWAWAPRSSGILWARKEHQTWLHPPVMSWGLDQGFTTEFDCVGTRDPSPWLSAPTAFAMMDEIGFDRIVDANHQLAWSAGRHLTERWGTSLPTPESMIGAMITVPCPTAVGSTPTDAAQLRDALLFEDHIEVQLHAWDEQLWVRVSAQIYNDIDDIERLAAAVLARTH